MADRAPRTGTWDDWLAMRPQPEPAHGQGATISSADFVAAALRGKQHEILDFGLAPLRDGLRDLFSEFEEATAGQQIESRVPAIPGNRVQFAVSATPERKVRILMAQDDGATVGSDYSVDKVLDVARLIIHVAESIARGEEPGQ